MKRMLIASASAIALLGLAACSDNTDATTTQSMPEPIETQPIVPAEPEVAPVPETDDTTTQSIAPTDDAEVPADPEVAPSDDLGDDQRDETIQPVQ